MKRVKCKLNSLAGNIVITDIEKLTHSIQLIVFVVHPFQNTEKPQGIAKCLS